MLQFWRLIVIFATYFVILKVKVPVRIVRLMQRKGREREGAIVISQLLLYMRERTGTIDCHYPITEWTHVTMSSQFSVKLLQN